MKIFCLEGEWEDSLTPKNSVESYLKYLDEAFGIEYIYRKVNTVASFKKYLEGLAEPMYKEYSVVYFAFHGKSGMIELDSSEKLSLEELMEIYEECFSDKIVLFGSCKTLDREDTFLRRFKKKTGARLISGYKKDVDFFDSSLLDMAFLYKISDYERFPGKIRTWLEKWHPVLFQELGFTVIT